MVTVTERLILMAFIRDWYTLESAQYAGELSELLKTRGEEAQKVYDAISGAFEGEGCGDGR